MIYSFAFLPRFLGLALGAALDGRGNEVPIIALSRAALNNFGHLIRVKWESCLSC